MGSNQSNLVNDQVNQILDNGTNSASYPAAAAQKINFNQNTDYKNSYVNADTVNGSTSSIAPGTKNYANQPTSSLMNPSSPKPSSTSSVERRRRRELRAEHERRASTDDGLPHPLFSSAHAEFDEVAAPVGEGTEQRIDFRLGERPEAAGAQTELRELHGRLHCRRRAIH